MPLFICMPTSEGRKHIRWRGFPQKWAPNSLCWITPPLLMYPFTCCLWCDALIPTSLAQGRHLEYSTHTTLNWVPTRRHWLYVKSHRHHPSPNASGGHVSQPSSPANTLSGYEATLQYDFNLNHYCHRGSYCPRGEARPWSKLPIAVIATSPVG